MLLLSYPVLEAYIVSCFEEFDNQKYDYSVELKEYVGIQDYQQNRITLYEIVKACRNFLYVVDSFYDISITNEDMDAFENINIKIFGFQEKEFKSEGVHRLLSMLSVSFIDLGILVLEE